MPSGYVEKRNLATDAEAFNIHSELSESCENSEIVLLQKLIGSDWFEYVFGGRQVGWNYLAKNS
jgi:hypothetical protein